MPGNDLAFTPAWELAKLLRSKKLSPVELTRSVLDRIARYNPKLNAFLAVAADSAMADAKVAERRFSSGGDLPPLLGLPVSIKDLTYTKGIVTTGGSLAYKDFVPEEDSIAVERLRKAGAIIIGKTNTPEFGNSATTENRLGDDCRNPWDTKRTSGGSSGGAAAGVAAGICPLAMGTDGGGSIRIPASLCGVFGIKPTIGTIPTGRSFSGMPIFSTGGPITRSVRDAAMLLDVTAGHDGRDPRSRRAMSPDFSGTLNKGVKGLRVAWSFDLGYAVADPEVLAITSEAARFFGRLGCAVSDDSPDTGEPFSIFGPVVVTDSYVAFGHLLETKGDLLTENFRKSMERSKAITAAQYSQAMRSIEVTKAKMADFFERYDLLMSPATAVPAFPCGQRPSAIGGQSVSTLWGPFPFTVPFNITGQPAASLPCGFTKDGLPVGLQIVGRIGEDDMVMRAAAAFEAARPWSDRKPHLD
ncbi:MAG: amidase [Chloroflexi bacterium]|nr:amidase [Chloroflexota bacterium]